MKRPNFFKSIGTAFLAGTLLFSIYSCDANNQSTAEEAEDVYETAETTEVNDVEVANEDEWDYDREYTYADRTMVGDRIRNEINEAERSLEQIDARMEQMGNDIEAETRQEWEETKASVEAERQALNARLQEVEAATEDSWNNVRTEVNNTFKKWDAEWDKLRNRDLDVDVDVNTTPEND